jgi:TPP-dependent indolepyruvate ferredoxin oxidoreductase alpha subunit
VVDLVAGLGVPREHIRIVVPSPHKKSQTVVTIREELTYTGLSVIIARRACVTYAKEIKDIKEARELKREIKVVST